MHALKTISRCVPDDRGRGQPEPPPVPGRQLLEVPGVQRRVHLRVGRPKALGQPQWHPSVRVHHLPVQGQHAPRPEDAHTHALQQTTHPGSHGKLQLQSSSDLPARLATTVFGLRSVPPRGVTSIDGFGEAKANEQNGFSC